MFLTEQDAVRIYARFCLAHYRKAARRTADKKAQLLKDKGDVEGHRVWTEVVQEIEKREGPLPH